MECDISNKCRACLTAEKTLALFETYENNLALADIIQHFLKVQLDILDELPKGICQECATLLIKFYNFAIIFEESNKKLQEYIASNPKLNEGSSVSPPNNKLDNEEENNLQQEVCDIQMTKEDDEEAVCEKISSIVNEVNYEDYNNCEEIVICINDLNLDSDEASYRCNVCSRNFKSMLLLKRHLRCHIQNRFICEICGYVTFKKSNLVDHMEMHSANKPYTCNYCGKTFRRRAIFSRHKKIHTNPKEIICEKCGQKFNDLGTLKTHMHLIHIKVRNFLCIICNRSFSLKSTLEKHVKRHQRKESASKEFACSECNLCYFDKSSLKRHFLFKHNNEII